MLNMALGYSGLYLVVLFSENIIRDDATHALGLSKVAR